MNILQLSVRNSFICTTNFIISLSLSLSLSLCVCVLSDLSIDSFSNSYRIYLSYSSLPKYYTLAISRKRIASKKNCSYLLIFWFAFQTCFNASFLNFHLVIIIFSIHLMHPLTLSFSPVDKLKVVSYIIQEHLM